MWLESFHWPHVVGAVTSIAAAYILALPLALERRARAPGHLGLRTLPLVSVGACAYLVLTRYLSEHGIYDADGLARTLRAVMTGIGFIGGGAIVKKAGSTSGVTTGAAVWNAGATGAAAAHGYFAVAAALALANLLILEIPRWLTRLRRPGERDRADSA